MTRPALLQVLPLMPTLEEALRERYEVDRLPPAGEERNAFLATHGPRFQGPFRRCGGR